MHFRPDELTVDELAYALEQFRNLPGVRGDTGLQLMNIHVSDSVFTVLAERQG